LSRTLLGALLGLLLFAAAAEAVLRLLPVSTATMTGYHVDARILGYPPHHRWTVATGWDLRNAQELRSNNFGFAAGRDFNPDPQAVALIGDSYVEASMLEASQRPGQQLERLLGDGRAVFAMGGPGSALLDYAERIRLARQQLEVRTVVILMEAGDVRQSLCGSGNIHAMCLDRATLELRQETFPPPSPAKRLLRHSALAQYVAGQLRVDPGELARQAFVRDIPDHGPPAPAQAAAPVEVASLSSEQWRMVEAVGRAFLDRLREVAPDARVVVVADGNRGSGPRPSTAIALERDAFLDLIRKAGLEVIDGEPIFASHAASSSLSLDVGPYDRHLNGLGVQLLMEAAARQLR
jgi:hypothetical protein